MNKRAHILVGIIVFFSVIFYTGSLDIPYYKDEVSWVFHTEFFDELFLKRNFKPSFWESYESFDHPQVSKYIFGGYLAMRNDQFFRTRDFLEFKYGRWQFYEDERLDRQNVVEFLPYIVQMRVVNMVFTAATVTAVYVILVLLVRHIPLALITSMSLLFNHVFVQAMLRATADAHVMFFSTASIAAYLVYVRTRSRMFLLLFAVGAGLAIATKLTGLFVYFAFLLSMIWEGVVGKKNVAILRTDVTIATFTVVGVWVMTNPAVVYSPFHNTFTYIAFRVRQSILLQQHVPDIALVGIQEKLHAVYCSLISGRCAGGLHGSMTSFAVFNGGLTIAGLIYLVRNANVQAMRYVLTFVLTVLVGITVSIPLYVDRYLLPAVIVIYIVQFVGGYAVLRLVRGYFLDR